jgi:site-specific DNA recombinase
MIPQTNEDNPTMSRSAVYARQSDPYRKGHLTTDQESLSITTQVNHASAKAIDLGHTVDDVFCEQITSEVFEDRPQLRKLLSRLDHYDAIIVYKYDRIVRDPDQLNLFIRACVAKGVRVISCTEQEIGSDPVSKMIGYVIGTVAQMEKIRIKERVRDAKQSIVDRGLILESGRAKYGYQYQNGKRVIDPVTSEIVKRIFNDVANGVSLNQLALILNHEGVPPPRVKWSQEGLGKIVRDASYYGAPMLWNQTTPTDKRSQKNGRRIRVRTEGKAIGSDTPEIVTRQVWDQAQINVAKNKKLGGKKKLTLWLRGHVFCGQCGHTMTPHPLHNGKYEYRCCYGAANKTSCTKAGYPIDEVENQIRLTLDHYFNLPELVKNLVAENLPENVDWQERVTDAEELVSQLKKKLGKVVARIGDTDDSVVEEAIENQMKAIAFEIKKEETSLTEARRLAGSARTKGQILADVDVLLESRGHKQALASLGVKVFLLAHMPDEIPQVIAGVHLGSGGKSRAGNKRITYVPDQITPDRKGRIRWLILRLFQYDEILDGRTSSNGRS